MNIFLQISLVGYAACMNYGGIPGYIRQGCWVNKPIYQAIMEDRKDYVFGVGSK